MVDGAAHSDRGQGQSRRRCGGAVAGGGGELASRQLGDSKWEERGGIIAVHLVFARWKG